MRSPCPLDRVTLRLLGGTAIGSRARSSSRSSERFESRCVLQFRPSEREPLGCTYVAETMWATRCFSHPLIIVMLSERLWRRTHSTFLISPFRSIQTTLLGANPIWTSGLEQSLPHPLVHCRISHRSWRASIWSCPGARSVGGQLLCQKGRGVTSLLPILSRHIRETLSCRDGFGRRYDDAPQNVRHFLS